jgi:M6 family metalloprotease-like protein
MGLASRRGRAWVWAAGLGIAALSPGVAPAASRHADRLQVQPRAARQEIDAARRRLAAHRADLPSFLHDPARAARIHARGVLTRPEARAARTAEAARGAGAALPDTVSLLVVRVGFAANRRPDLTSMAASGDFNLVPDTTVVVDPPPHDVPYFDAQILALADYYRLQSHGRLEVRGSVFPPSGEPSLKLSDMADYGPGPDGRWTLDLLETWFRAAGGLLDSAAVGRLDLPSYDCIAFCHPGSDLQNDIDANSPNDLPSFFVTLADSIPVAGGEIRSGVVFPETTSQDGLLGGILGAFCHEFGHSLGLPDWYDTNFGLPVIGEWDLMDSGNAAFFAFQVANTQEVLFALGLLPTGLSAMSRVLLGWDEPYAMQSPADVVTLSPANSTQPVGPRVARLDVSADEYFLIENRRDFLAEHVEDVEECPYLNRDAATGVVLWMSRDDAMRPSRQRRNSGEYDFFIAAPTAPEAELGNCGQTGFGLLVWHVDERVIADGYGFNAVNADERGRGLRLVEASGDFEIGDWRMPTVSFVGDGWNDPFRAGYRTTLGATTVPNNWNNDWAHTGWEITDVRFVAPESHELSVRVHDGVAGWPLLLRAGFDSLPPVEPKGALVASIVGGGTALVVADSSGAWMYDASGGRRVRTARVRPGTLAFHPRLAAGDAAGTVAFLDSARVWLCDAALAGDSLVVRAGFPIAIPGGSGDRLALVGTDAAAAPGALVELANRSWVLVDAIGIERSFDVGPEREADPIVGPVAVGGAAGVALVGRDAVLFAPLDVNGPPPRSVAHGLADTTLLVAAGRWRNGDGGAAPVVLLHPDGRLRVVDADGGIRSGFQDLPPDRYSGLAVADVTGDGELDIVAASATHVAGATSRGARLLNSPRALRDAYAVQNPVRIVAGPIVADVAGDSLPEILVATDLGLVYALDADFGVVDGYPRKMLPDLFPAELCAADVDGDGAPEIVGVASIAANAAAPPGGSARSGWWARGGNFARTGFVPAPAALRPGAGTRLAAAERPLLAYPNPAPGDVVQLRMTAARAGEFALAIYTLEGERVFERRGTLVAGTQEIPWRVGDLAPGVYVCRFVSPAAGVPTPMVEAITLLR